MILFLPFVILFAFSYKMSSQSVNHISPEQKKFFFTTISIQHNVRGFILKYDSFKKDNQKNCWSRTCLLPSNFIVLINTDIENYGQFILSLTEQSETRPFLLHFL